MGRRLVMDTEAKGLLNSSSIDYTSSPYKIKDERYIHCAGFVDVDTKEEIIFRQEEVYTHLKQFIRDEDISEIIGHNIINYDLLSLKLCLGIDYHVGVKGTLKEHDTIGGKNILITDTLVMSKTLNPDRPMHSIDYFGSVLGLEKINWRARAIELGIITSDAPKGAEFLKFHEEMVTYMMRDCHVNVKVWQFLIKDWGNWEWSKAYETEKAVAEIVTRQEHRGFRFDKTKAVAHAKLLDTRMEELRATVEPLIPPKPLTKGALNDVTPPATQFKKNGEPSVHILNFAKKHGGEFIQGEEGVWRAMLHGRVYTLPMPPEPLWKEAPAEITDTLHIKQWLVGMGWEPTQWKERDLTVDSKKKKLNKEKFDTAVDKWVEQTLSSTFKNDRLEMLGYSPRVSKTVLLAKMKMHDHLKRPLKVYTNPTLTVGMEKEIDPKLLEMKDKFAHAKEISDYLTYRHRRNSILGGGIDPDDDEDMQKGWLSNERINVDGRINTPADTCGTSTSRMKHRVVANVPRVSSTFGKEMRELFGVDSNYCYQMGYDFDSLINSGESKTY